MSLLGQMTTEERTDMDASLRWHDGRHKCVWLGVIVRSGLPIGHSRVIRP